MHRGATILHADLDAFYASVEIRRRPELQGLPVAVGGGVVLSCTYQARSHGVRSGMPLHEARLRCPRLVVVSGDLADYAAVSRTVMEIFERFTPVVEPISIDEAFLDVRGSVHLLGPPARIGEAIRAAVRVETGLPVSIGAAGTKFLAKVASRVAKPDGLLVIPDGAELGFLHGLAVELLWGVGPVTGEKLSRYGVRTIGELASIPPQALSAWLGPAAARHLHALAWNRDPRPVRSGRRARSVGAQSTFGRDIHDPAEHRRVLLRLADRVAGRLRAKGRAGRTVTVRVRFRDFETTARQTRLPAPTASTSALFHAGCRLAQKAVAESAGGRGLRLIGIAVSDLEWVPALQLELPLLSDDLGPAVLRPGSPLGIAHRALDEAVDRVRAAFGHRAVDRARNLNRE